MNIAVGRNNAGKSTLVEACRLLSLVTQRYANLSFKSAPPWLSLHKRLRGVSPSLSNININFASMMHRYYDPPAIIKAEFEDSSSVQVYIGGENKIFATISDNNGQLITSKSEALHCKIPQIHILPQISPMLTEEVVLNEDYVRKHETTSYFSIHFRNNLRLNQDCIRQFKKLSEDSWPQLRIEEFTDASYGEKLHLLIRDGDFVAEVGWMGHGLQMWLQIMWFLSRIEKAKDTTIILDEPDVFMHSDLQRKLIRLVRSRFEQIIITTHSVEIMSEVEPDNILIVDKKEKSSKFADDLPTVQKVIKSMGGIHNIQLTRIISSNRFVFVEGDDLSYLKTFQNLFFPNSKYPIDIVPHNTTGGWGGWKYVIGLSEGFKNIEGNKVSIYCILDSDYKTEKEIQERLDQAKEHGIRLHIWKKKEIENYFLVPSAILRLMQMQGNRTVKLETIIKLIDNIVSDKKDNILDATANAFQEKNRGLALSTANKKAREKVNKLWCNRDARWGIVCGSEILSELLQNIKDKYKISLSIGKLVREIHKDEVDNEMISVLNSLGSWQLLIYRI